MADTTERTLPIRTVRLSLSWLEDLQLDDAALRVLVGKAVGVSAASIEVQWEDNQGGKLWHADCMLLGQFSVEDCVANTSITKGLKDE